MNRSRVRLAAVTAIIPATFWAVWLPAAGTPQPQAVASEELIAEKDPGCAASDKEDVASTEARKGAWRCRVGENWSVFVNGVRQGGTFDEARALFFRPGGEHLAFAARRGRRWMMVVAGQEPAGTYEDIGVPVFSPKGGHLAYGARRDKRWLIVEDGKEGTASYSQVAWPMYSRNGKHMAFGAKPAKKWVFVLDGQAQGGEFDALVAQTFSLDGEREAHVVRRGNKLVAIIDGKEGSPFDIIGGLGFSADGRRAAYAGVDVRSGFANEKALGRAIIDGTAGPDFEGKQIGSLLSSMATGSTPHLARGYFPQLFADTHGLTAPVFSPDGKRVAYAARPAKDRAAVFVDGQESPAYPSVLDGPVFSPDSQHVAVVIGDAGATSLVVDGTKVGRPSTGELDFVAGLLFSPDSRRVAYVSVKGGDWYARGYTVRARRRVYVDGVAGPEYDALFLGPVVFTADGRHVIYIVEGLSVSSKNVSLVVVDGVEGKHFDYVYGLPRITSDGGSIEYVAQTGRKLYLVTQPLETRSPTP